MAFDYRRVMGSPQLCISEKLRPKLVISMICVFHIKFTLQMETLDNGIREDQHGRTVVYEIQVLRLFELEAPASGMVKR